MKSDTQRRWRFVIVSEGRLAHQPRCSNLIRGFGRSLRRAPCTVSPAGMPAVPGPVLRPDQANTTRSRANRSRDLPENEKICRLSVAECRAGAHGSSSHKSCAADFAGVFRSSPTRLRQNEIDTTSKLALRDFGEALLARPPTPAPLRPAAPGPVLRPNQGKVTRSRANWSQGLRENEKNCRISVTGSRAGANGGGFSDGSAASVFWGVSASSPTKSRQGENRTGTLSTWLLPRLARTLCSPARQLPLLPSSTSDHPVEPVRRTRPRPIRPNLSAQEPSGVASLCQKGQLLNPKSPRPPSSILPFSGLYYLFTRCFE